MNASALDPYSELTKPRIVTIVLVTTALGFFVGGHGIDSPLILVMTLLGTALSTGGPACSTTIWNAMSMPSCVALVTDHCRREKYRQRQHCPSVSQ